MNTAIAALVLEGIEILVEHYKKAKGGAPVTAADIARDMDGFRARLAAVDAGADAELTAKFPADAPK